MRKTKLAFILAFLLSFMTAPAAAWVFVPGWGDYGWHETTMIANFAWSGTVGWVISNEGNTLNPSMLLLDNLSHCSQPDNKGFESGTYAGFSLVSTSNGTVVEGPVLADNGTPYTPVEGKRMSQQWSYDIDTSMFLNAFGEPGTTGSILETHIDLEPMETFSFSWAFLAFDDDPYNDFAMIYFKGDPGYINIGEFGLAQIVPLPSSLLLLVSGLVGMGALGRRKLLKP
jgi:hypothetical protein